MRDERGQLGGLEGLAYGVLVFVIGLLIVVNAWAVVDAKLAAASAAREAARAYVEAANPDVADEQAADAAREAIRGFGRDPERMTLSHEDAPYVRCQRISFAVAYRVSIGSIPLLGRQAGTFVASARHSELVDPYRTGVDGEAHCVAG